MVRNPEILASIKHNAARFGIFGILTFGILYQTRSNRRPIDKKETQAQETLQEDKKLSKEKSSFAIS
jgi:hypothetical protein